MAYSSNVATSSFRRIISISFIYFNKIPLQENGIAAISKIQILKLVLFLLRFIFAKISIGSSFNLCQTKIWHVTTWHLQKNKNKLRGFDEKNLVGWGNNPNKYFALLHETGFWYSTKSARWLFQSFYFAAASVFGQFVAAWLCSTSTLPQPQPQPQPKAIYFENEYWFIRLVKIYSKIMPI